MNHNYFLMYINTQWFLVLVSFSMCVWAIVMDAKKSEADLYDPDYVLYFGSFGTTITSLPI